MLKSRLYLQAIVFCCITPSFAYEATLESYLHRSTLGYVTPLGWPRSLSKSDVERRFLESTQPNALKARSMIPIFNTSREILDQTHYKLLRGQTKFPRILSQNGQSSLEGQGQWPPFSITLAGSVPGCICGANLVITAQISNELSCGQNKVHGQTDGQTDAGNDNTTSAWKDKGQRWTQQVFLSKIKIS